MQWLQWHCGQYVLDMHRPKIMGIVNVTPDSFSDGGRYCDASAALRHCEQLVADGADILDIGAESSRPGAQPLTAQEELARLQPIVSAAASLGVPVSVDSYRPAVMQQVLEWGASIINDIWGFRQPGALDAVAQHDCGMVVMHMHQEPQTMQGVPMQGDGEQVLEAVRDFLAQRCAAATALGIDPQRLCVDAGFGFGKTTGQNFALLARFPSVWAQVAAGSIAGADNMAFERQKKNVSALSRKTCRHVPPVLMGCSRKSSLGAITGLEVGERLLPSVVAAVLSVEYGARVVRVHDVKETRQALAVWSAARGGRQKFPKTQIEN